MEKTYDDMKEYLDKRKEEIVSSDGTIKVPISILELMKDINRRYLYKLEEFKWRDITKEYLQGKRELYLKGLTLREGFLGYMRTGKSTIAILSANEDNEIILSKNPKSTLLNSGKIDMSSKIHATPNEFLRVAKKDISFEAHVIDEGNSEIEATGLSSTTDMAYMRYFDEVCAEKGISTKIATPVPQAVEHCLLIHHVIGNSKTDKITKTKLFYNDPMDRQKIPLGIVTWDVSKVLEEDYYKIYGTKKSYAYNLILKNNIRSVKDLEFALIVLISLENSKKQLAMGIKDIDLLSLRIENAMNEVSHIFSFVAKEELSSRLRAFCTLLVKESESEFNLNRTNRRVPLSDFEENRLKETIRICKEDYKALYDKQLDLIRKYCHYLKIGHSLILPDILKLCKKYNLNMEDLK